MWICDAFVNLCACVGLVLSLMSIMCFAHISAFCTNANRLENQAPPWKWWWKSAGFFPASALHVYGVQIQSEHDKGSLNHILAKT